MTSCTFWFPRIYSNMKISLLFGGAIHSYAESLLSIHMQPLQSLSLIEGNSGRVSAQESHQLSKSKPHIIHRDPKSKRSKSFKKGKVLLYSPDEEFETADSFDNIENVGSVASDTGSSWTSTDWGQCQTNCGPGYQYRILSCVDLNGHVIDETRCDASIRPADRRPCEGDCISCEITGKFFSRIGVAGVPLAPAEIKVPDNSMCAVQGEGVKGTCCTEQVESEIQVMYAQLQFGMKAQAIHRDKSIERISEVYDNVTIHLNDRISEIDDALSTMQELLEISPVDDTKSTEEAQKLHSLRESLVEALQLRANALDQALSDLSAAQDSFMQQLDLMNSSEDDLNGGDSTVAEINPSTSLFAEYDPSSSSFLSRSQIHFDSKPPSTSTHRRPSFLEEESSSSSSYVNTVLNSTALLAALKDPNVRIVSKACETAISQHFQDLSCGACNPTFPVTNQQPPRTPVVSIPVSSCDTLYSQCADSLAAAHQQMYSGAEALFNSQKLLMTVSAHLQGVLDGVWQEMKLDWLPGFAPALMAKPNLLSMGCMQNLDVFQPMALQTSEDFCHNYFSFASPRAFLKRVSVQLDRGVMTAHKFSKCDRCVHETAMFLTEILGTTNRASLRITLPSRTKALLLSCGQAFNPINTAMKTSDGLLPPEFAKMNSFERTSPRVLFSNDIVPLKSLNQYAVANRGTFSALGSKPAYEWKFRSLVNSTSNKTLERTASDNSLHRASPDDMLRLNIMNMNCMKHSDCYEQGSPSGGRPWWFCAHPNVCKSQPGACDADGASLLATGPKCVRGPCTDDKSAIDENCPDNAVCPANGGATTGSNPSPYFGLEYFARFDLKTRGVDPIDISATRGVCDCALGDNGEIVNPCEYARCLAYASIIETHSTCSTNLVKQCMDIKATDQCANDATLDCSVQDLILIYPPENPGECPVNQMALQSEANGSENITIGLMYVLLIVVSTMMTMI